MTKRIWAAASAATVLLAALQAHAEPKPPSDYVLCDGSPPTMSAGELAGRVLAITATLGVVGGLVAVPETGDKSKRAEAQAGVSACNNVIGSEQNEMRRVQLMLARSVHNVEAARFEEALKDASAIDVAAGSKSTDRAYTHGPRLSGYELQAAALVRLGKPAEAEKAAMAMADAAPYDLLTQLRAYNYVALTDDWTPQKKAYFDRLGRIMPETLQNRAIAEQQAGDFAASAASLDALADVRQGFFPASENPPLYLNAFRAVAHLLAGDLDQAAKLAAQARVDADKQAQGASAGVNQATLTQVEELLDFYRIGRLAADGKLAEGRSAFAARSRWVAPPAGAVAVLTEKLRQGADPSQLTGALARTSEAVRADAQASRIGNLVRPEAAAKNLFTAVRLERPAFAYKTLTGSVWNTDKSRFLIKRKGTEKYEGEMVAVINGGVATGEALLLHCALLAQARGKSGFVIAPARNSILDVVVRFGDKGDPGMPERAFVEAGPVIAALGEDFPNPAKPH